jgi:acyl-CoA thioesterase-1
MLQGFERPPWWAVAVMALCTAFLAVALPIAIDRGRVTPAELAAAERSAGPSSSPSSPSAAGDEEEDGTGRVAIAALGDGYTAGPPDAGEGRRWFELLTERFPWDVTPFAETGTGFVTGRAESRSFSSRVPEIVAARPDVVVVAGGRDDVSAPRAEVADAVRQTLGDLRAGLPDARIVVVGVLWPGSAPGAVFAVNRALQTGAAEVDATFVDALNGGWFDGANRALVGPDGAFPTDEGHEALAQRIGDTLLAAGVPDA